jgi:hypothetical protein
MMLMIPAVYQGAQSRNVGADFTPPAEIVEKMTRYNEKLAKSGALLSLDGLHPPATAARVSYAGGKGTVTDGPFAGSKEVLGGYWMIQVKSRDEAVQWASKVPAQDGDVVEVRQVFDPADFPEDVKKAAESPIVRAQLDKSRNL